MGLGDRVLEGEMKITNTRWGSKPRGKGPWRRTVRRELGFSKTGIMQWSEPEVIETSDDYDALWQAGHKDWGDNGIASTIIDADGVTCMIFD